MYIKLRANSFAKKGAGRPGPITGSYVTGLDRR